MPHLYRMSGGCVCKVNVLCQSSEPEPQTPRPEHCSLPQTNSPPGDRNAREKGSLHEPKWEIKTRDQNPIREERLTLYRAAMFISNYGSLQKQLEKDQGPYHTELHSDGVADQGDITIHQYTVPSL